MSNQILNTQSFENLNTQISKLLALRGYLVETPAEQVDAAQLFRLFWQAWDAAADIARLLDSSTFDVEIVKPLCGSNEAYQQGMIDAGVINGTEDDEVLKARAMVAG